MKRSIYTKLLSVFLAMVMTFTTLAVSVGAADDNSGKYIKDVFIAYGEDKGKVGIGPNPQSPIPNPQSPIPIPIIKYYI